MTQAETYQEMLARRTAALGVSASDLEHLHLIYYTDLGLCGRSCFLAFRTTARSVQLTARCRVRRADGRGCLD